MKRRLVLALFSIIVAVSAFAADETVVTVFEKPFRPVSPVVVGQGGSFTANGYGWDAFFSNPASLAGKTSITLASVNPWLHSTGEMLRFVLAQAGVDTSGLSAKGLAPRTITTVELPEGFELPADSEYSQEEFEDALVDMVNSLLEETGAAEELGDIDTITIPDSWAEIDPQTIADSITETGDVSALTTYLVDFLDANPEIEQAVGESLASQFLPEGFPTAPNLRAGVSVGLGLIVKGFGLGVSAVVDVGLEGGSVLTTSGDATLTMGVMAGYAHQFKFSDNFWLKVGGLVRPIFRVNAPVAASGLIESLGSGASIDAIATGMLDSLLCRYGVGLGIDVGAILGVGPFSIGLAATDLFDTRLNYKSSSLRTFYDSLTLSQSLPAGTDITDVKYVIPMDVRLGASFHPDLGGLSFLIDPTVHLEIGDFLTLLRQKQANPEMEISFGDIVAFGAEVRLLRFLAVRAGYYEGTISAGIGAKLLILDVNAAAFIAREDPALDFSYENLGDVGFAAEVAIRI